MAELAANSKKETKDQLLTQLFDNSIKLLKDYAKDERIITPLFKTLDFIFEKQEIQCWGKSKIYARQIYDLIVSETKSTKSIMKVISSPTPISCRSDPVNGRSLSLSLVLLIAHHHLFRVGLPASVFF